ncbi:hypothetical protein N7466_008426 [Penicillium verhagenii]|uniref:uncharacterized protein n=1 Tax=Penicillium verhagenii TaxID=1562060 RepID=UPI00254584BD|nr:uncharacterized protein N7466_008426 [Penicillium verhagenii]KAJ5924239.1 hypothetical protein N7466_008426 [Penicillium verhagenii]
MGKGLASLIGSGIGFTSEAIHAARHRNKGSVSGPDSGSASGSASASTSGTPRGFSADTTPTPPPFPTRDTDSSDRSRDLGNEDELPAYSTGAGSNSRSVDQYGYPADEKHRYEPGSESGDEYEEALYNEDRAREMGGDEEAWQLDEMSEALPSYDDLERTPEGTPGQLPRRDTENDPDAIQEDDSEDTKEKKTARMIRELVSMAGPPGPKTKLPFPVIIPQRRPGAKKRGFVRAYAPVLQDCGIGQDVFLKFISDFHKASQASMWLQVIVVGASITSWSPSLAVSLTAVAVQILADTAQQFQIRKRTTSYLDVVNEQVFKPRGQYAMIMKFTEKPLKPKKKKNGSAASDPIADMFNMEQINVNGSGVRQEGDPQVGSAPSQEDFNAAETIAKFTNTEDHPEMNAWKTRMKGYRLQSGETRGQMQLPESAPLIYPRIDRAAQRVREGKEAKGAFASSRSWASEYIDRRRQIEFEADHKGSALAVTEENRKPYTSRYNDPNHPANSGNLISTLTGGKINPKHKPSLFERAGSAIKERDDRKRALQGLPPSETFKEKMARKKKESGNRYKLLREDVLYLMIVNMPTPQELEEAVARLRYMVELENAEKEAAKQK